MLGEQHPAYASSLRDLGLLYTAMGNYLAAEPLLVKALAGQPPATNAVDLGHAASLSHLSLLYRALGDFERAQSHAQEALEAVRRLRGDDHPDVATALVHLAGIAVAKEDHAAAEKFCLQALEIQRGAFGKFRPSVSETVSQLAVLSFLRGDHAQAEALHKDILENIRRTIGENNGPFVQHADSLASMYEAMANLPAAEPLLVQNVEIVRRAVGEDNKALLQPLQRLADLYRAMDRGAAAEPLYRQAIDLARKAPDQEDDSSSGSLAEKEQRRLAGPLKGLALLYLARGNHIQAEPLLRQALEIDLQPLGEDHADSLTTLQHLASLCASTGREPEAMTLLERVLSIQDRQAHAYFALVPPRQRALFLQGFQNVCHKFLSLVLEKMADSPETVAAALDLVLRRKAVWVEALADTWSSALERRYPELQPQLRRLLALRRQIAVKILTGPGTELAATHEEVLSEWQKEKRHLLKELAESIPELALEARLQAADRQAVAAALPDDAALVEFVCFRPFDFGAGFAGNDAGWGRLRYLAFVLGARQPQDARLIALGEAEPIQRLIADLVSNLDQPQEAERSGL